MFQKLSINLKKEKNYDKISIKKLLFNDLVPRTII